jgi:hypothetical protein
MGWTSTVPQWLEKIIEVFHEAKESKVEMACDERPIMLASFSLLATRMGMAKTLLG